MVEPQSSRFWQVAIRSGLLDEATLRTCWDLVPPEKRTHDAVDRRLARQVVNIGKLTLWQAQQMLAGRWQGLRIDRYELQDIIGHGGMGRVYLAHDVRLSRQVALKILSRERMNNPRALTRFRREAKVGAQLQHENLVRIYDEGEAHGVRYLVMEYIEGKTIGKLVAEMGRLPAATAADLGRQIALGLEHLHKKGLLHRDVNPMNVLVDRHGTAKLTDLGLAIDLGDMDDIVTRDGATVGTFDYISPEQARHSRSVDGRADLYSLGCTLFHMIAGRVPFPTANLPEKLFAHQGTEPENLATLVPDVPAGLAAVVAKLMKKTADERYPRAIDTAKALEPFANGHITPEQMVKTVDTPAAQAAGAESGATPNSDPDLDLKPEVSSTPNSPTSSSNTKGGGIDFLPKIDFGPEPALSETSTRRPRKSTSRSTTSEVQKTPRKPIPWRVVGIAGAAVAAIVIVGLVAWNWKALVRLLPKRQPAVVQNDPPDSPSAPQVLKNAPPAEIAIRARDGSETEQSDLRAAIARLSGGGGEIVLRTSKPIRAEDLKKALTLAGGHLIIRAEGDARPDIRVVVSGDIPWIEIAPQARLTLVGLSIQVTAMPAPNAKAETPPTVIASHGNVILERCMFSVEGADRSPRMIAADGVDTRVSGCFFEGFDRPVSLAMYPGANARFANCLFVRDVTTDPAAGWAISANRLVSTQTAQRKLTIDHCTALGAGLLAAEGFTSDGSLAVTANNNAVRTSALLMTSIGTKALTSAITWTGKDNAYALNGAAWVVLPPKGFDAPKDGPTDMSAWTTLMPKDAGVRSESMKFAGDSTTEGHTPEDYRVVIAKDAPSAGADPAKVGPGAKP